MADLNALREQLAAAMNTVPEMRAFAYIPDQIQAPVALVEPDVVDWSAGAYGRGAEPWTFLVRVLVADVLNSAGQKTRDEFFGGSRDIKDAIEAQIPTAFVSSARKFDAWEYAGVTYLGVEVVVEVIA